MNNVHYLTYGWIGVITAIIAGKWALELGLRQWRQLLWMIAGLVVPPLALLAPYVRLMRQPDPRTGSVNAVSRATSARAKGRVSGDETR